MQITLVPDSSIASAPPGLTAAVEAAASIFEQDFSGDYDVNISYGWGTFDNAPSAFLANSGTGVFSLGGETSTSVNYSQLRGWLIANAASSAQITAVASLPASAASFPNDANTFFVSPAEEKALGVVSGDSGGIDGSIGFNTGDTSSPQDWEPAALTEIVHALGWNSIAQGGLFPDVADLFRYSSPGHYQWTSEQAAYFSIDGGNTDLADFSTTTNFDQTLFTDLPADDPLRLPFTSAATTLTSFDIEALSVIGFGVASAAAPPPPPRRFNAGGSSSDILWQNTGGQASIWEMSGTNVIGGGPVSANPGQSWAEIGTGDFNDDGHSDILWQNANGKVSIWEMSGTNVIGGGPVSANPGQSWTEIGTGDFNDDGHSDILWQNATGQVSIWEMSGTNVIGGGPVSANPGQSWTEIGTGDFNDDGHSDILWQNANGQASIWEMSGTNVIGGGPVSANPGPAWKAIGTGDFNDDGHSDILWQNASSGQVSIWEMSANNVIGGGPVASNPGPSWHAMGTGDFNGDGHSDILWRNANGQTSIWEMSGTNMVGGGPIASNPGLSWSAVGTGDFNHDGHSDILWQNANGQASIWEMNGTNVSGGGPVASNPGPGWLAL
jgi:uncharacterized protein YbdZ (MbtH family)